MDRLTVTPYLVAMIVAIAAMPTNVYKICARNAGTLEVEPWRVRTMASIKTVMAGARAWFSSLWSVRAFAFAAIMLLAVLLASHADAGPDGVMLALTPAAVTTLRTERATMIREAEALQTADGTFANDEARASFDTKMARVAAIDREIAAAAATPPAEPAPAPDVNAIRTEERSRISGITDLCRKHGLDEPFANDLVSRGVTLEAARAAVLEKLVARGAGNQTHSQTGVQFGDDARDKWTRGVTNWLLARSGMAGIVAKHEGLKESEMAPGEFRGMSLIDIARESLTRAGVDTRGMDRMKIAGMAMGFRANFQTISDFAVVMENALHKVLRAAYGITPDTWSKWCGTTTTSDFRTHNFYRLGALTELQDLNEHGEFKNKSIPDAEKATYAVGTKGNIIAITRQVIVNDDLGFVMRLTEMLGRAGKLTIEKAAYAKLALNAGLGPNQADGQPLFHANRANVGAGAALSAASIDADRVLMVSQKEPGGEDFTDLRPAVLLVPAGLGGQARVINASQYDPDTVANKSQMKPNAVQGLYRDVVDTPRLAGTRRYSFADPSIAPVVMVSFLEGQQEPVLETQDGWRTDGVEMKARLDVGVDVVDFRGAVTNAGA